MEEEAAAPSAALTPGVTDETPGTGPAEDSASPPKPQATAALATPAVEHQSEASQGSDVVGAAPVPAEVSPEPERDVAACSVKRRLEDVADTTGEELRMRQLERNWKVLAGWKGEEGKPRSAASKERDKLSQ